MMPDCFVAMICANLHFGVGGNALRWLLPDNKRWPHSIDFHLQGENIEVETADSLIAVFAYGNRVYCVWKFEKK